MDYPDRFDYTLVIGGEADSVCKAIITVRALWGEDAAFDYLHKLQTLGQYKNPIQLDSLIQLIEPTQQEQFLEFYHSNRAELLRQHDISKARSMGANLFPSIVIIDKEGHMVCRKGYQEVEEILAFSL